MKQKTLLALIEDVQRRLDRLQNDLDFVKNRLASYLGGGIGLTYLVDETPIYINTNDFGCPANFINGGRYEEEYLSLLTSFRRPDSIFLDVGANLGVFSLRLAPFIRQGKILAFEPNATIRELFTRSVHLNGISGCITVYSCGASDRDVIARLSIPAGHVGGGSVASYGLGTRAKPIELRRLDGLLADLSHFDIAKIDVEGHELAALQGMPELIARSANAVILLEKLSIRSGIEAEMLEVLEAMGMTLYAIDNLVLTQVDLKEFERRGSYFLAAREGTIGKELKRNFICLYPQDLYCIGAEVCDGSLRVRSPSPGAGSILFHGPYWYLPRGTYELRLQGELGMELPLTVAEKFGFPVAEVVLTPDATTACFVAKRDLTQFEVVGRFAGGEAACRIESFRLTRLG